MTSEKAAKKKSGEPDKNKSTVDSFQIVTEQKGQGAEQKFELQGEGDRGSDGNPHNVKKGDSLMQSALEGYVEVTTPDFEQRMLEMIEKLNRKVNSLSTSSGSTLPIGGPTFTDAFSNKMRQS
eukprot:gene1598-1764_t